MWLVSRLSQTLDHILTNRSKLKHDFAFAGWSRGPTRKQSPSSPTSLNDGVGMLGQAVQQRLQVPAVIRAQGHMASHVAQSIGDE